MFGLFEGTRRIDGEEFHLEGEFPARIIPNASHESFQVWVSAYPSASVAPAVQAAKAPQE